MPNINARSDEWRIWPGPWTFDGRGKRWIRGGEKNFGICMVPQEIDEDYFHALLIAKAPEMLDALEKAAEVITKEISEDHPLLDELMALVLEAKTGK